MKTITKMGLTPPGYAELELSAYVEVLPDDVKPLSLEQRFYAFQRGYFARAFNDKLNPMNAAYVKAGTKGTIGIYLNVRYMFFEVEVNFMGLGKPDMKKCGLVQRDLGLRLHEGGYPLIERLFTR